MQAGNRCAGVMVAQAESRGQRVLPRPRQALQTVSAWKLWPRGCDPSSLPRPVSEASLSSCSLKEPSCCRFRVFRGLRPAERHRPCSSLATAALMTTPQGSSQLGFGSLRPTASYRPPTVWRAATAWSPTTSS